MSVQMITAGVVFLAVVIFFMNSGKYSGPVITAEELKKQMNEKKKMVLVDVRTPGEYMQGHLEGAVNVPLDSIQTGIGKAVPDKSSYVVTYCMSGRRSRSAAAVLVKAGYSNLINYSGSVSDWLAKGNQLTK